MTILKLFLLASIPSATTTFAIVETLPPPSSWTSAEITAIFLGLNTLLTTYLLYRSEKAKREVRADVKEVHTVVQGGTLTLLKRISSLEDQRAETSGRSSDQRSAEGARIAVADKETIVADAAKTKRIT